MAKSIAIIGAGLTGLMAALHLAQRNFSVLVYDKRSLADITAKRYTSAGQIGRSMSMDISARGIFALQSVGCFEEIASVAIPMTHRIFHNRDEDEFSLPYGQFRHENILTVSRSQLFQTLYEKCMTCSHISIHFDHTFTDADFVEREITLINNSNGKIIRIAPEILIGADGINSKVRPFIENKTNQFSITHFPMSYKELTIPTESTEGLSINAMHKWTRENAMLVAQPNHDRSFTCALLLSESKGSNSFNELKSAKSIREFFNKHFLDASRRMPDLEDEYMRNPIGRMTIVNGRLWSREGFALIIGDAAHGMVPFFGQGVNCCFEDCTFLANSVDEFDADFNQVFFRFDQIRVADANAISKMSYENYPELFSYPNLQKIDLVRKIDALLMEKYSAYRSYHNLVCFDQVSYSFAERVKAIQTNLLTRLSQQIECVNEVDYQNLEKEFSIYQRNLAMLKEDKV